MSDDEPRALPPGHPVREAWVKRIWENSLKAEGTHTSRRPEREAPPEYDPQRINQPFVRRYEPVTEEQKENPHPTEMDKQQDAEREAKGTGDAKPDDKEGGEQVEGSTFTDQGRPV